VGGRVPDKCFIAGRDPSPNDLSGAAYSYETFGQVSSIHLYVVVGSPLA
jgi:hypothetical protein